MQEVYTLTGNRLTIDVKKAGAEICSIKRLQDNKEYMWSGDPEVWSGISPILFPIVGALKDRKYIYNDKEYSLPQHGFFRDNNLVELSGQTPESLTFMLKSDEESLLFYPFHFEFYVTYILKDNTIQVSHRVKNIGRGPMYFSLGGHPAFKCPMEEGEIYADYFLEFSDKETVNRYNITDEGLIGYADELVLKESSTINLHYDLFNRGALVFKEFKSNSVSLVSKRSGKKLQVNFKGFPYLGIWAKPRGHYVCIEPWLGIADSINSLQQLEEKEGIIKLDEGNQYEADWSIEIS